MRHSSLKRDTNYFYRPCTNAHATEETIEANTLIKLISTTKKGTLERLIQEVQEMDINGHLSTGKQKVTKTASMSIDCPTQMASLVM